MATNTVGVNMEMGCERCQAHWESTQIRDPLAALAPRFWYLFIMFANNKLYTEQLISVNILFRCNSQKREVWLRLR